jgi:hypothetical protein
MKLLVAMITSLLFTVALAGFNIATPGPAANTVVVNGHAYSVLHGPAPRPRGSRLTLITGAPIPTGLVTINGITYHVQGTVPPRPQGSRLGLIAPSTIGTHTVVVDGITYAVRP